MIHELALCSGVLSPLAARLAGWKTVAAVENDAFCREVLLRRQLDGVLPLFPIWDELGTFDGRRWRGAIDLVTAGFPCQPFSCAGRREGEADERNLWPEVLRVIREVGPEYVFLENVAGLLAARGADGFPYLGRILGELAESGFDCRWNCIPASALGAPHQRDRLWIVAHAMGDSISSGLSRDTRRRTRAQSADGCCDVSDADREHQGHGNDGDAQVQWAVTEEGGREISIPSGGRWPVEPDVGRVADGVPFRVDRLRALGGGWVPIVATTAWEVLK